jgi:hypothetical protein
VDPKTFFYQVRFNGKAKWDVPSAKTPEGLWDLGLEPSGTLTFTFTTDPKEYKKEMSKIAKEAAALDPNDPKAKELLAKKPQPKDLITLAKVSKEPISDQAFEHIVMILIQNYKEHNTTSNISAVVEATGQGSYWSNQATEILKLFKDENSYKDVLFQIAHSIRDPCSKLALFSPSQLIQYRNDHGAALLFSSLNPTGHYCLNLRNPVHMSIARCLVFLNRLNYERILKKEAFDRSQYGNQSCFRNERHNAKSFRWSPQFVIPTEGTLEFDFVYIQKGVLREDN